MSAFRGRLRTRDVPDVDVGVAKAETVDVAAAVTGIRSTGGGAGAAVTGSTGTTGGAACAAAERFKLTLGRRSGSALENRCSWPMRADGFISSSHASPATNEQSSRSLRSP